MVHLVVRHRRKFALAATLLGSVALPANAWAQNVVGTVLDISSTRALGAAEIELVELQRTDTTDRDGSFRFTDVPAGTYTLVARYTSAEPVTRTITVPTSGDVRVDFQLGSNEEGAVLVIGQRANLASSISRQRAGEGVSTVLTRDAIGQFPDQNVAEALRRAPGINVLNDQGEGRFVSVRGLDPELNSTSINGNRVLATGGDSRAAALDVIPSELVEAITIKKSLTPDMDADTLGGSVEIETTSAFNRKQPYIGVTLEGSYNDLRDAVSPKAGIDFSIPIGSDFGIAGGFSYYKRRFSSDNVEASGWATSDDGVDYVEEVDYRDYDVTRHGHVPAGLSLPPRVRLIEAGHPVPDAAGMDAAHEALALAHSLGPNDHLLALISGGGSALLPLPVAGVSLADKQALTHALLASGAPIAAINRVRQALSAIKGGRLAAAVAPARLTNTILSDVPGDDPALVASGPTVPPGEDLEPASAILARYGIVSSAAIAAALSTHRPLPPIRHPGHTVIGANSDTAIAAAARVAADAGFRPIILGDQCVGSVSAVAERYAARADAHIRSTQPIAFISGGELDAGVAADAPPGGRNTRFLIEFAARVRNGRDLHLLSADTDGIDGTSDVAGGILSPESFAVIAATPEIAADAIHGDDTLGLVRRIGRIIGGGPTCTNVNDLRILLMDQLR